MYYNGQIVWDIDNKKLHRVGGGDTTFAWSNLPENNTHLIDLRKTLRERTIVRKRRGKTFTSIQSNIFVGALYTLENAQELLDAGKIRPAEKEVE